MNPALVGLIGMVVLILMLFSRMPIGFVMLVVGLFGFSYLTSFSAGASVAAKDIFGTLSNYSYTVCPMFIFMGYLALASGVSGRLYQAAYAWIGWMPGGLAMATAVACAAFGAICGSPSATIAAIGAVALPEMKKFKYDSALSAATVAAGGVLGIMIPPSLILIVYGIATENSIGALFLAGFLPGLLILLLYCGVIYLRVKRNPTLGPGGPRVGFRLMLQALGKGTLETLIIFLLVMGGISGGIFTATEGGAIGVTGILTLGLVRRQLHWQGFTTALHETTLTTGMIYMFLAGVTVLGRFLTISQIPLAVADIASGLAVPRFVVILGILFIFFIFGCFMDTLPFMLLTIPIFYPLAISLGYDPIWYGVIMVCCCGMGGLTPPVGIFVYVAAGVAKDVPITAIFSGVWPFVGSVATVAFLLVAFPQIATFLPNLIY